MVVRLAGLTFNDGPDDDGNELICSDLSGWDGGNVDLATVEKPLGDGAFVVFGRLTAWSLTLAGWVVAGPDGIGPARRKLSDALYTLAHAAGTLEVDEDDATYTVAVWLDSNIRSRQAGPGAISFEVGLLAPTPTKTLASS